jgi:hypothetical protein
MLKEPCPYHKGPTNHNLEDCYMFRRYFESLGIKKDDKKEDPMEKDDDKDEGFPRDPQLLYDLRGTLDAPLHVAAKARASRDLLRTTRDPPLPRLV